MASAVAALIVFLVVAVILYLIFKAVGISTGASVALALFFGLIVMAFIQTPMSIYNAWGQDVSGASQVYAAIAFLATLYIIIYFLYICFKQRDLNAPWQLRAW
jgi:hypothetical protein